MKVASFILGFANLPLGLGNGLMLSAIPQLMAARHMAEPVIADVTAVGLAPGFAIFLAAPLLDRRFSRRTYAVAATTVAAAAAAAAILLVAHPVLLALAVLVLSAAASVNLMAIGGWFGTMLDASEEATLGTSMSVAFAVGFALVAVGGVPLVRALSPPEAAALLALAVASPLALYAVLRVPPPRPGQPVAAFAHGLLLLLREHKLRRLLLLFALPTGCFALTNTLSGLGADYRASERLVGVVNGAAVTATGIAGALLVPPLVRRVATARAYLAVGAGGAAFTLLLAVGPHTPATFAAAIVLENLAQSLTLTMATVAALQSLEPADPYAATRFGLLTAMPQLPVTAMQWIDGHAYGVGGLAAMYGVDGGAGLATCALMALVFTRRSGGSPRQRRAPGRAW